jgi:hypothetical protein
VEDRELASLTPLEEAAVQANEFFNALIQAGFSEAQALTVVIGIIAQGQKRAE